MFHPASYNIFMSIPQKSTNCPGPVELSPNEVCWEAERGGSGKRNEKDEGKGRTWLFRTGHKIRPKPFEATHNLAFLNGACPPLI